MGGKSLSTMVMVVVVVSILVTGLRTESLESVDVLQHPSSYHLAKLKRSVDQIKRSWVKTPKSQVFKRSTDSQADDLLLNSLASYCINFQSDPKIAKHFQQVADSQPLRNQDITGFTRFKPGKEMYGMEPKVFPIKVWAQRDNDKVWIIFEIAHSDTAVISRIDPFNFHKVVLETPDESVCRKIVSKARFVIDVPLEECEDRKDVREIFEMTSTEDARHTVTAHVDLCKYDKYPYNDGRDKSMISQSVSFLTFRIIPDPGDFVLIKSGQDLTIDLKVNYSVFTHFSMNLVMWDWTTEKTLHSSAWVRLDRYGIPRIRIEKTNYDNEDIFTVDFLSETTGPPITVSLKITFNEASGTRSGKLYLRYSDQYADSYPYMKGIVPKVTLERNIDIQLEGRPHVFPDDLIYLGPQRRFLCDKNGDKILKDGLRYGKNCTVRCQAFGKDIASLYITKLEPIESPVTSASYVLQNKAVAILDMGLSSGDVEGDYRCVAVDRRGQTMTQDLKLYTSLFTKLMGFQIIDNNLETAHILCSARGDKDLNISFVASIGGKNETLLDKYERNITRDEEKMTVRMDVPWADLKVPLNRLTCFAKGDRGDDRKEIKLNLYKGNRYGIYPIVEKDEFKVTQSTDEATTITCFASGAQPIDMELYLTEGYAYETQPLQLDPNLTVTKTTETHDDRVSMTYTFPTVLFIGHRLKATCKAKNKFEFYKWTFNLRAYLK